MSSSIQKGKIIKQETKISILVLAHNVEKYIVKALESILEQKVNFNYEILIGDDCATDGIKKNYPEISKKISKKNNIIFNKFQ
jgi:glycosyltransferase involved in cell wall biosynthesis